MPIAHVNMTIDNLIPDSLLAVNNDGSVKIVYSTHFPGLSTDTLLNIPDTTIQNSYHLPFGSLGLSPSQFFPTGGPQNTTFAVSNAQIVMGILDAGKMIVQLKNDLRRRVILRYQIPNATKNLIPFDTSFLMQAAPDSLHGYTRTATIDLGGYTIDFTGTNHDRVNTLSTTFTAQVDPTETNAPYLAYPEDTVAANCLITGIKPFYFRGYFGNQTVAIGPTESPLSFFRNIRSGSLGLDSLKMSLDIDNYIGMDAQLKVNRIWSRNANTGTTVNLQHSIIGQTINVNRGQYTTPWPDVLPASYHFDFTNSNSNAKALIENMPQYLGYDATLITDPLGNVSGNNDFLFAAHGIDATLNVEMPLNLFASQLVIADTIAPDFLSVKNRENVIDGKITLHAQNSFPFATALQIYLLDVNGNVSDSLISQPNLITAGQISWNNGYFSSIGFNNSEITIPLSTVKTVALFNSPKIIIKATFDTNSTPTYAKIYSTNQLNIQLNADFTYRVGN
jgi:hypothetical protein